MPLGLLFFLLDSLSLFSRSRSLSLSFGLFFCLFLCVCCVLSLLSPLVFVPLLLFWMFRRGWYTKKNTHAHAHKLIAMDSSYHKFHLSSWGYYYQVQNYDTSVFMEITNDGSTFWCCVYVPSTAVLPLAVHRTIAQFLRMKTRWYYYTNILLYNDTTKYYTIYSIYEYRIVLL